MATAIDFEAAEPRQDFYPKRLAIALAVGIAVFFLAGLLPFAAEVNAFRAQMAAAVTSFVAACWLSNAMPMVAASLLPIAAMPLLGAMPIATVATAYTHPIVWMFFGGFVLALGVERWGLHRRLALRIIQRAGVQPRRLILGFMGAAAFLSMWLNNSSTTVLLLPIALALIETLGRLGAIRPHEETKFAFALLVCIAYASSIGGMGTPIGTAPNALFLSNYAPFEDSGAPPMTFFLWMSVSVPLIIVMVPLVWWYFARHITPLHSGAEAAQLHAVIDAEASALPPLSTAEKRMLILFASAAFLWITRRDIQLGDLGNIPGWWHLLPIVAPSAIGDGAVAILIAVLSFIVPSGRVPGEAIMDWPHAKKVPWDILLLIGSGIAIAQSFEDTGLAQTIGQSLKPLAEKLPALAVIMCICLLVTFLTEVTSNTATTALILPVLASIAVSMHTDPRLLMLPATLSASCAFMLPIATPPNAIVFSSGRIEVKQMAKGGLWINLLGVVLITLAVWLVAVPLWHIEMP